MPFSWPWPFRRRQSSVTRRVDEAAAAPAGAPVRNVEPFRPDAGLIAALSERAEERDTLPILGPQGGLPATARFLTVAREMADALPAAGWSQEVVAAAQSPASVTGSGFLATLPSLMSFRDPAAIVSGEAEGTPFPDWGQSGASTGVFAGAGGLSESLEGSRPRQGSMAARSSIIARLTGRPPTESRGPAGRRERAGPAALSEGRSAPRPLAEPARPVAGPVRRGVVTEAPPAAGSASGGSEPPQGQPHVQRVTESPTSDAPTFPSPQESTRRIAPSEPLIAEDVSGDIASPSVTAGPPLLVARPVGEGSTPAALPLADVARTVDEPAASLAADVARLPGEPSSPAGAPERAIAQVSDEGTPHPAPAVPTPVAPVEMPLVMPEAQPVSPTHSVAREVSPDVAATATGEPAAPLPGVLPPAGMGIRRSARDLPPSPEPFASGDRVPPIARAADQEEAALPLVAPPGSVPEAQDEPPVDGPRLAAPDSGARPVAESHTSTPLRRSAAEEVASPAEQPGPRPPEHAHRASPAVGHAAEFASQIVDLNQPFILTEPWSEEAPTDGSPQTGDENVSADFPPAGASRRLARPTPLRSPVAGPPGSVSRSVEAPGERSSASVGSSSRPVSPAFLPPGEFGDLGEPRTEHVPARGNLAAPEGRLQPLVQTLRPVRPLGQRGDDDASPWTFEPASPVELQDDAPRGWPGPVLRQPWNGFELPPLELTSPPAAGGIQGASPVSPQAAGAPERPSTPFRVSRLADLPLAPPSAALREVESAPPATGPAEPASGAVAAAAPAGPPAAAPAEGDVDKLADRVWQVMRRRLQIERERQRGLP